jgi:hypothetical protein
MCQSQGGAEFFSFVSVQEMLERYVHWNEDIGEWQLKCVAYTGNNMRKTLPGHSSGQGREVSHALCLPCP